MEEQTLGGVVYKSIVCIDIYVHEYKYFKATKLAHFQCLKERKSQN